MQHLEWCYLYNFAIEHLIKWIFLESYNDEILIQK